jgi:hypothetical protein
VDKGTSLGVLVPFFPTFSGVTPKSIHSINPV